MIIRELVTRLGWKVDMAGAAQYDAALRNVQARAQTVSTAIGTTLGHLAASAISGIAQTIGRAALAIPTNIIAGGDALTTSMNRINGALAGTGEDAAAIYQQLRQGALETGVAVADSTNYFARFAPALRDIGQPASEAVKLLNDLQKGMIASGATTALTAATMTQIGQSFNSMNLQLGEFNSFNEQAGPDMVRAFAEATGHTMSTIRKAIEDGKITGEMMVRGFQAAGRAGAASFDTAQKTVSQAMAEMRVAVGLFAGEFDNTFGITRRVTSGVLALKAAFTWMEERVIALRTVIAEMGGLREAIYLSDVSTLETERLS